MVKTEEKKNQITEGKKYLKNDRSAEKIFNECKSVENISIILSLKGLLKTLSEKNKNKEVLETLKDAAQLAKYSKSNLAEQIKEYVLAEIYYQNNDTSVALCHYNNAKNLSISTKDEYSIMGYVIEIYYRFKRK